MSFEKLNGICVLQRLRPNEAAEFYHVNPTHICISWKRVDGSSEDVAYRWDDQTKEWRSTAAFAWPRS